MRNCWHAKGGSAADGRGTPLSWQPDPWRPDLWPPDSWRSDRDDDRAQDLVSEGLPLGIPERPQVADVAGNPVQDVHDVTGEGHPPADRLAGGLADELDVQCLLAPGLPGPASQNPAVVDTDAERDDNAQPDNHARPRGEPDGVHDPGGHLVDKIG